MRITAERVAELEKEGYFQKQESPACVAILPFVEPHFNGIEIGVFMGCSSRLFLEHCKFMYFIDPCREYEGNPDKGWFTTPKDFLRVLKDFPEDQYTFLQLMSVEAAGHIPEPVDFVFVDGNHTYPFVKQDIELYWPKIKSGGFISGHDYNQADVQRAVHEFFYEIPVEVHQDCWRVPKL